MTDLLIVVDMQRDFVSGALGSEQARAIVPAVAARIQQAKAENTQVVFTLDTHEENYMNTREGRFLPCRTASATRPAGRLSRKSLKRARAA